MAFSSFLKRLFGAEKPEGGALPPMVDAPPPKEHTRKNPADTGATPQTGTLPLESVMDFVRHVVTALVDEPGQVRLELAEKGDLTIIQIHCFKRDIGKVIGKSGKTISALRTLVNSTSARVGRRLTVDVMDD